MQFLLRIGQQKDKKAQAVRFALFVFIIDLLLVKFEDGHKGALRNFDSTDLTHSLLTLLLFLEELSLTRDVTTVTLRPQDVRET